MCGGPWKPGDDVAAYVWLFNKASETDRLLNASTPAAASVELVDADGKTQADGVTLPPNKLQQLEPGKTHLILRDLRQLVRGGDYLKLTLTQAPSL